MWINKKYIPYLHNTNKIMTLVNNISLKINFEKASKIWIKKLVKLCICLRSSVLFQNVWNQIQLSLTWCFLFCFSFQGFHILRPTTASQQAHPAALHGQPWAVHAPPQDWLHRGSADEGPGQRGEAAEKDGEVGEGLSNLNGILIKLKKSHVLV